MEALMDGEEVRPLDLGMRWDVGAPLPFLLQNEKRAFLAFYLNAADPTWDGTTVEVVDPAAARPAPIGIIAWQGCWGAVLGPPNDEVIKGHRLWRHGLKDIKPYGAAEVLNSAWIADLERVNRVHPHHNPARFAALHHYILMFHDSTFECLAEKHSVQRTVDSMPAVLVQLVQQLVD